MPRQNFLNQFYMILIILTCTYFYTLLCGPCHLDGHGQWWRGHAYGYADSDSEEVAIFILSLGRLRVKKKIRYGCELTASAVTITLLAFLKVLLKVAAAMMECRHLVVLSSICVQIFGFSAQAVHLASAFDQVKIKLHPVPTLSPVI